MIHRFKVAIFALKNVAFKLFFTVQYCSSCVCIEALCYAITVHIVYIAVNKEKDGRVPV